MYIQIIIIQQSRWLLWVSQLTSWLIPQHVTIAGAGEAKEVFVLLAKDATLQTPTEVFEQIGSRVKTLRPSAQDMPYVCWVQELGHSHILSYMCALYIYILCIYNNDSLVSLCSNFHFLF